MLATKLLQRLKSRDFEHETLAQNKATFICHSLLIFFSVHLQLCNTNLSITDPSLFILLMLSLPYVHPILSFHPFLPFCLPFFPHIYSSHLFSYPFFTMLFSHPFLPSFPPLLCSHPFPSSFPPILSLQPFPRILFSHPFFTMLFSHHFLSSCSLILSSHPVLSSFPLILSSYTFFTTFPRHLSSHPFLPFFLSSFPPLRCFS